MPPRKSNPEAQSAPEPEVETLTLPFYRKPGSADWYTFHAQLDEWIAERERGYHMGERLVIQG